MSLCMALFPIELKLLKHFPKLVTFLNQGTPYKIIRKHSSLVLFFWKEKSWRYIIICICTFGFFLFFSLFSFLFFVFLKNDVRHKFFQRKDERVYLFPIFSLFYLYFIFPIFLTFLIIFINYNNRFMFLFSFFLFGYN